MAKGLQQGIETLEKKLTDRLGGLEAMLSQVVGKTEETEEGEVEPPPAKEPGGNGQLEPNPLLNKVLKQMKGMETKVQSLESNYEKALSENRKLQSEAVQRQIAGLLDKELSEAGFEQVPDVRELLLAKHDLLADASGDVIVLRKGTKEPLEGEGGVLTLPDLVRAFKGTELGKRFVKAPKSATTGTEYTGSTGGAETTGGMRKPAEAEIRKFVGKLIDPAGMLG